MKWLAPVLLLAAVVLLEPVVATSVPDFTGTWVRDERASDDAVEQAKEADAGTKPGGGVGVTWPGRGRGGGGSTPGGFPGPGGGPGSGQGPGVSIPRRGRGAPSRGGAAGRPEGNERVARLAHGLEVWQIEQDERELRIRNANGETRVLFTDGRIVGDGLGARTVTAWHGAKLQIETRGESGSMTETLSLDPSGARLAVTTALELGRGEDITFETVYERVAEPDHPASAPDPPAVTPDLPATPSTHAASEPEEPRMQGGTTIRFLPLARSGAQLSGKVLFETLTLDPEVAAVEFFVDGARVERRAWPPFEAKLTLADPPREQVIRAVAFAANDRMLGDDEMVVNRIDPPFRVHIASIAKLADGALEVLAEVSAPRRAELDRVTFFLGERPLLEMSRPPFTVKIPAASVDDAQSFVRAVATLRDGRELEDVALLAEGVFSERIDVQLIQLQVLVTDRTGAAVAGLGLEDFEILDGGKSRRPERLYPSDRVALLLGLAIDSSGSMWPLWEQTRAAASYFLDSTLSARDRAFLVDFDSRLRLLQAPTGDRAALDWALGRLEPHGGTALYDSILFSLLQYDGEPGRRAMIVLTDGLDSESRSDPRRTIDLGRRLGVPVYVIALSGGGGGMQGPGVRRSAASTAELAEEAARRNQLKLVTDPTGGRLFHVVSVEQVARAFAEIQEELRRQYVLTYYTDRPPGEPATPEVRVRRQGMEVRSAVPLDAR